MFLYISALFGQVMRTGKLENVKSTARLEAREEEALRLEGRSVSEVIGCSQDRRVWTFMQWTVRR